MKPKKRAPIEHVVATWNRQGWYPAPWSHHPQEVKDAIRQLGWRPKIKECYANCQRFALYSGLDVEYREGWVVSGIALEHAWLIYKGSILDLTLNPDRGPKYLNSIVSTREEIREHMFATGTYALIKSREVELIGPYANVYKELNAELAKKIKKSCPKG